MTHVFEMVQNRIEIGGHFSSRVDAQSYWARLSLDANEVGSLPSV
ncbi:MAG: hypothetical protein MAG431_00280 [Chloroflexi bacterium]|nr:hypothetical protein [Chloroflexota bacterium]